MTHARLALAGAVIAIGGFVFSPFALAQTATGTLTVRAQVVADCTVSSPTLDFGLYTGVQENQDEDIELICTAGTTYTVALDGGSTSGNINDRRMSSTMANELQYQLYTDSGRTIVWGDDIIGSTVSGTLIADTIETLTVYATIFGNQTLTADTYEDTVTITVDF